MKLLIFLSLFLFNTHAAYLVKKVDNEVISVAKLDLIIKKKTFLKSIPEFIAEKTKVKSRIYSEILYPDHLISQSLLERAQKKQSHWIDSEVRYLVNQGPYQNRINISILGDGYTVDQKQKFFKDVDRLVKNLFKEKTFKSYLSLFNIVAIFTPSSESGITDLKKKDTAFSLYRSPKGSKRAIIPGNSSAIERALNLVSFHTHYPIIIANDEFYGGLGGRYAITTSSLTSGAMVLRHELGHNFSDVGEEYDGGQVYSGANFSRSTNVPWSHWLTKDLKINKALFLTGAYLWQNLANQDYIEYFTFNESAPHLFDIEISSVGWQSYQDVKVFLDGNELEIEGIYTVDRSFFKTKKVQITTGMHEIKIIDNNKDGDNVLAFANSKAYPLNYDFSENTIAAFNVFDAEQEQRGYRPTHSQCLMRNMRSLVFCPVDQENIWIQFFKRISLIDSVKKSGDSIFEVKTPNLDDLEIRWYLKKLFGKEELVTFRNKKMINLKDYKKGRYLVEVRFKSSEVRITSSDLVDERSFSY